MSKILTSFFLALCTVGCGDSYPDGIDKAETEQPAPAPQQIFPRTFETHWMALKKTLTGLDSAEAWAFCWNQPELKNDILEIDSGYTLDFVKRDLGGNNEEEMIVWLQLNDYFKRIVVYQRNGEMGWRFLWDGYGDDIGSDPVIEANGWISCPSYGSCSNCSISYDTYYEVRQDTVVELMSVSDGYNVDHEITGFEAVIYEQCDGRAECIGNELHVNYLIQFSEVESGLIFLKDNSVKVVYEWDDDEEKMEMTSVSPGALKPFIKKWNKKGQKEYTNRGYHPNDEVLPAYMEYKKHFLIGLQYQSKFKAVIKKLAAQYECSWTELMTDWPEKHSWGGFHE